jgi:hypothetical protein
VISPTQRTLPDYTLHSQETDIHTAVGIRTHNPSKRTAANARFRPHGHRDRPNQVTASCFHNISNARCINHPNKRLRIVKLMNCIRWALGSKLGRDTDCPHPRFLWISSVVIGKFRDSTINRPEPLPNPFEFIIQLNDRHCRV